MEPSAKEKLLKTDTPKLAKVLENILANLPMKDLLLSQRVCRKWRQVITGSIPLQQALFFVAEDYTTFWTSEGGEHGEDGDEFDVARHKTDQMTKEQFVQLCVNDTPFQFGMRTNPLIFVHQEGSYAGQCLAQHLLSSHSDASWRKMYLTTPPAKLFCVQGGEHFEHSAIYPHNKRDLYAVRRNLEGAKGRDAVRMLTKIKKNVGSLDMQLYDWVFEDGLVVSGEEDEEGFMGIEF